jgi:hypothetical protein
VRDHLWKAQRDQQWGRRLLCFLPKINARTQAQRRLQLKLRHMALSIALAPLKNLQNVLVLPLRSF